MPASYWESLEIEQRVVAQIDADRNRSMALSQGADPKTADLVSEIRRRSPWIGAGTALALAKAAVPADSSVVKTASNLAAQRRVNKGVGWHTVGEAVGTIGRVSGTVLKPVARAGFTALQTPYEVGHGIIRMAGSNKLLPRTGSGVSGATQSSPVSDLAAQTTVGQFARGQSLGEGYLTYQSPAGLAQAQAARDVWSIDGHAATPGRIVARTVTDPGSASYNILSGLVDATLMWKLDPAVNLLNRASKAFEGGRTLTATPSAIRDAAGLVGGGHRPDVIGRVADEWLRSKDAARVLGDMAADADVLSLWRKFGKAKNGPGGVPINVLRDVADSGTADEVADVLRPHLGVAVRDKPTLPGPVARSMRRAVELPLRRSLNEVRLLGEMPQPAVNLDSAEDVVRELVNYGRNVKAPTADISAWVDQATRAGGRNGRYAAFDAAFRDTMGQLTREHGLDDEVARRLTRWKVDYDAQNALYGINAVGDNLPVLGAQLDGMGRPLPTPHLLNELIHQTLPLPNARDLRKSIGLYSRVHKVPGLGPAVEGSSVFLDFVQGTIWKTGVLLRGAWTIRVVGEEQIRMAASGLNSAFRHPISALAWIAGDSQSNLAKALRKVPGVQERGATGLAGPFEDFMEFRSAMSRRGNPEKWRARLTYSGKRLVSPHESAFVPSWADNLAQYHQDDIMRRVAGGWAAADDVPGGLTGNSVEDAKRWFWDGGGRDTRLDMAQAPGRHVLIDRGEADLYIDSLADRLRITTGDIPELRQAVASGQMGGKSILHESFMDTSKDFRNALSSLSADPRIPKVVVGDRELTAPGVPGQKIGAWADRATDAMFNFLMTRRTNELSRSPAFRQIYWKRVEELLPAMDRTTQAAAITAAEAANLEASTIKRLRSVASKSEGTLGMADADTVAKAFALDSTRDLLYDLSRKGQLADIARHFFPFAEAWKEVLTRWAKIGTQNPAVFRRAQMVVQGGRGADPDADGQGFFYRDPQTGEEMFTFPGSELFTKAVSGVPTGFKGSLAGLNLFSQNPLMPGFGPTVQVAASKLLPDTPDADWARKLVIPFGETDPAKTGLVETFLPAWAKKALAQFGLPIDQAQYASTFAGTVRYLASTGQYNLNDPTDLQRLEDDARKAAKVTHVFRGLAQSITPTSPSLDFRAFDKDGHLQSSFLMAEKFREFQTEDYQSAVERFIATFGEKNLFAMQGSTEGTGAFTKLGMDWGRRNPDIVRDYPEVADLLAPQGGAFDFAAYRRSLDTGQRRVLSTKEFMERANDRVARMMYSAARDKLSANPSDKQRAWLASVRESLRAEYPGFDNLPRDDARVDRQVRQLGQAAADPRLVGNDAAEGMRLYFSAREKALEAARKKGLVSFGQAKSARNLRAWLRNVAASISAQHPDFTEAYERVLRHEMVDDDQEVAVA